MWESEDLEAGARRKVVVLIAVVAAAALGFGLWYWYVAHHRPAAPPPPVSATPPPPASTEPEIANPLPAANEAAAAALPALNDSDTLARDSIAGVLGRGAVERLLMPQNIVRHIVATVDNLPRKKVAVELRPVRPTPGATAIATQGEITALSDANFERYAPLVKAVQGTDVKALALVYRRLYPLFQQSYEDLGYPGKYFNDRLVEVIDHLLQAPVVQAPIPLVQPRVMYEYADADLEGRSAGQKLLIRMGPANERAIKAKLREFRAEIVNKK
ncbi:MAG: DUF3014 domain-containing protein [Gammaproteobacteria bacterium]|nr:MAG: DUF3014 domain-containing protein [Gammaproteobacteria bacterium]TLY68538.1 MAG: DUF3014 domain-containing protein [Gammaproteobacteria bacterium]TLZ02848.1 MAG: DUF3014 domain-containing protein [Gammaproteobacteria bacterium]TLZ10548.1 MAG: DUF3014 domain-containing protein [Gammaproteobacteria bacterium]TLZ11024.1 MAG: DUF3014 domain-containing protein [Gammaproteobacteria bacterium]